MNKNADPIASLLDGQGERSLSHEGDIFEFEPVPLPVFITDKQFLGLPPLSPKQHDAMDICTQIYFEDTLNKLGWRKRRYISKCCLIWGKGCLHKDSLLLNLDTGELDTIENFAKAGKHLWMNSVRDEAQKRLVVFPAKSSVPWFVKKDHIYLVKLADGSELKINKSHRMFKHRHSGGTHHRGDWEKLKSLSPGDKVATTVYEYNTDKGYDLNMAWVIGLLLGDGIISGGGIEGDKTQTRIVINKSKIDFKKRIREGLNVLNCFMELKGHSGWSENAEIYSIKGKVKKNNSVRREIIRLGLLGHNCYNKFIPKEFFTYNKKVRIELLRGLLETDGWVSTYSCTRGDQNITEIGYCSASKDLAFGYKRLLSSLGIFSRLKCKKVNSEWGISYNVKVRDKTSGIKLLKLLGWEDKSGWREGKVYCKPDIRFEKIISITYIGKEDVYDLEVEGTHNYVDAMGVVNHNSGKDFVARIMFLRMAYLLLCLKNPQAYYYDPRFEYSIENIDMLNTAANDAQAVNVFFSPLRQYVTKSPFFKTRCEPFTHSIIFDKAIRLFSGNSEAEPMEGMNLLAVILDEIASFKTDEEVEDLKRTRARKIIPRSASSLYEMALTSVITRFPKVGKVISISFPRFKGDFITSLYEEYKNDQTCFASFGTTYEVNPTKKKSDFDDLKRTNPALYQCRILCNPGIAEDAFFKNGTALAKAFPKENVSPFDNETGKIKSWFFCKDKCMRFGHVDLSKNRDRAAVCFVHAYDVDKRQIFLEDKHEYITVENPLLKMDILMYFTAPPGGEVDYNKIMDCIIELEDDRGFKYSLITFDGYQSIQMRQTLEKRGTVVEELSVDRTRNAYEALQDVIYSGRLIGYYDRILLEEELPFLIDFKGRKIEHRKGKSKDGSDALAGAVYNCIKSDEWGTTEFWSG